jgi:nucleotide-binding universal stress UspA family protein
MFRKVVWATDGSDAADTALPLAKSLAAEGGGELRVVHCDERTIAPKGGVIPLHTDQDDLRSKIEKQVAEMSQDGVPARLQLATSGAGGAAHVIAGFAASEQADLIVVGTRGRTALGGLLLGSVTQRLLHIAPCPVLAIPATGRDTGN